MLPDYYYGILKVQFLQSKINSFCQLNLKVALDLKKLISCENTMVSAIIDLWKGQLINLCPLKYFQVSYSDTAEGGDRNSDVLKKSVDEIKRLQEEVSALRQENLQLKVNRVIKKEITEKARNGNEYSVANFNFSKKNVKLEFFGQKSKKLATLKKLDAGSS